jgi:hypothetical protein
MCKGFIKVFWYGILLVGLVIGCLCSRRDDQSKFNKESSQTNKDMRYREETGRTDRFG